jgi:hypothetical protein
LVVVGAAHGHVDGSLRNRMLVEVIMKNSGKQYGEVPLADGDLWEA